jgi:hypothetical protein
VSLSDNKILKFVNQLKSSIADEKIPPRIEKAIRMYKKETNLLYIDKNNDSFKLRGKICKHIILALVAVIKSDQGTSDEMIKWVERTKLYVPHFNKDEATAIFLKYSNALTGVIEWRPVEVLPEDFFAF